SSSSSIIIAAVRIRRVFLRAAAMETKAVVGLRIPDSSKTGHLERTHRGSRLGRNSGRQIGRSSSSSSSHDQSGKERRNSRHVGSTSKASGSSIESSTDPAAE
ncbi:unnamed protein product, partial [Ectocarpus sp. 12 AP-2014]